MNEKRYNERELPRDLHDKLMEICHGRSCRLCPIKEMCPHDFVIEDLENAYYELFPEKANKLSDLSENDILELIENKP